MADKDHIIAVFIELTIGMIGNYWFFQYSTVFQLERLFQVISCAIRFDDRKFLGSSILKNFKPTEFLLINHLLFWSKNDAQNHFDAII